MYDAFLKLIDENGKQLRGGSQDSGHLGWIDVRSFSIASESMGRPRNAGSPHEVSVIKEIDIASPVLFQASVVGQKFKSAVVEIVPDSPSVQKLVYKLDLVFIVSIRPGGRGNDDTPREEVSLNGEKMSFAYGPALLAPVSGGAVAGAVGAAAKAALRNLTND